MKVHTTAEGGGKHVLVIDGVEQERAYYQEREAITDGLNALLRGATEVHFTREGRVLMHLTGMEPAPEPDPDPPIEPGPEPPSSGDPVAVEWLDKTNVELADPRAEGVPAPPSGAEKALRFFFPAKGPGTDSWAEQRFGFFGLKLTEFTNEYNLYVPENYHHRVGEGPDNNKFLRYWAKDAAFALTVEIQNRPDGGSYLERLKTQSRGEHRGIADGQGQGVEPWWSARQTGPDLIGPGCPIEPGKWSAIKVEFSSASARDELDGYLRLYVNGELVREWMWDWWADVEDDDGNSDGGDPGQQAYVDMGYLLGWANSGFDEKTYLWVDDFRVNV